MTRQRTKNRRLPPTAAGLQQLRRGFTLIELLVSIALLIVLMVAIARVFSISSDSATRVAADTEVLAASAAFRQTVSDQIDKMTDGLLVINCPAPTPPEGEIRGGQRFLRLRHDSVVFMTHGDVGEYQSFTDPTRGDPANFGKQTANSAEALVYFGPGLPLPNRTLQLQPQPLDSGTLTASEWVFLHRSILLLLEKDANADPLWMPPDMDALTAPGGLLNDPGGVSFAMSPFYDGMMDAVVSSPTQRADTGTIADIILGKPLSDLLSADPSIAGLWQPGLAPRTASVGNSNRLDFYARSGASFIRHLADLRIEWTDGRRVDPLGPDGMPDTGDEDLSTRWFGLRPDPAFTVDNGVLDNITTAQIPDIAVRRQDVVAYTGGGFADSTQEEIDAFRDKIEWDTGTGSAPDTAYRAIWRGDTWRFRPKALRFTYRIYDGANRMKQTAQVDLNENGDPDPDGPGPSRLFTRFGRQFTVVVKLP